MQLWYGANSWPVNGTKITSGRRTLRDEAGLPYEFVDRVNVDGFVEGSGQVAVSVAMAAMIAALAVPRKDLIFRHDDGTASATVLLNANSLTGVVVTEGPDFPEWKGPEWVNQRAFRFTAEADYAVPGRFASLIAWDEEVEIQGGGPLYMVKDAIEGPPQRQLVFEQTACTATQVGSAVGYGDYPDPAPMLWPFALTRAFAPVKKKSAKKRGVRKYSHFRIEWRYEYSWIAPLVGGPTQWT